jgi:hypothetical protein
MAAKNEEIELDRGRLMNLVKALTPDDRVWITTRIMPTSDNKKAQMVTIHIEKNAKLIGETLPASIDFDTDEFWSE